MTGTARWFRASFVALAVAIVSASLVSAGFGRPTRSAGNPSTDKLAQILARGTLILSTDPGYYPQSYLIKGAKRLTHTKCAANQMTANQMAGYDADTGKLVAKRMGVEACFVTPTWTEIVSGHWDDRWDISYGSGAINTDRMARLYMTQPYYAAPQLFFVATKSHYEKPSDLDGKTIGVCAGCTHELYLAHTLKIPGVKVQFKVKNTKTAVFDVEGPGLAAVAAGKIDAFLCAAPEGFGAIHNGVRIRAIKEPAFFMYPTGFVDKYSALDVKAFVAKVNSIMDGLHADGTMKRLSIKDFFGVDYATKAGQFDLRTIGQQVK
jgi:polar amino acid transport system substrate-binding protein